MSLLLSSVLLCGCTPNIGGNDYDVSGAGKVGSVEFGVVTDVREVRVNASDPSKAGTGAAVGGVSGGLLGAGTIGGGSGRFVSGAVGGLLGAGIGHLIEQKATQQMGNEYTVRMDDGRTVAIVQGKEPPIAPGQRVKIINSSGRSKIIPA